MTLIITEISHDFSDMRHSGQIVLEVVGLDVLAMMSLTPGDAVSLVPGDGPLGLLNMPLLTEPEEKPMSDYKFPVLHADMIDIDAIRSELSMANPLAVVRWDSMIMFVLADKLKKKAALFRLPLPIEGDMKRCTNVAIQTAEDMVVKVRNAEWQHSPEHTAICEVHIPKI